MASFVSIRAMGEKVIPAVLRECGQCGLRYSDVRLDRREAAKLYEDYRGENYFQLRSGEEPWYTRSINDGLGHGSDAVKERTNRILGVLEASNINVSNFKVLDFGGDQGHFLSPALGSDLWVYDVSGQPPLPGIQGCSNLDDLPRSSFDLVMMGHVLEHVMEPLVTLDEATSCLRPGGFLYVEVPLERPRIGSGFHATSSIRPLRQAHDFISTLLRLGIGWLPMGAMLKISEHVNFFDELSLRVALERSGLHVDMIGCSLSRRPLGRSGVVFAMAHSTGRASE